MQVLLNKSKEGNDKSELRMEWKLFSCLGRLHANCSSLSPSLAGQAVCQGHNEQNFRYFRAIRRKTHQERGREEEGEGKIRSTVQMTPLKSNVDETAFVVQAARKRMFMSERLNRACE